MKGELTVDRKESYIGIKKYGRVLKLLIKGLLENEENEEKEYKEMLDDRDTVEIVPTEEAKQRLGFCKKHKKGKRT